MSDKAIADAIATADIFQNSAPETNGLETCVAIYQKDDGQNCHLSLMGVFTDPQSREFLTSLALGIMDLLSRA